MDNKDILSSINSADDLKKLPGRALPQLCSEIRNYLISTISNTGGHLASNLGIVELTVALHRVFDSSKDRIIFDVGHQAYVHKILTGRKDSFNTLRCFGGISGFPRPCESDCDPFVAGHASTSISVGLGMAHARTLQHDDYNVVCVIGDGSLTGGMAYEALNDAGQCREPMIVILNDNSMSISKNVGAVSKYLAKLRCKQKYIRTKELVKSVLSKSSAGKHIVRISSRIKSSVKSLFFPSPLFEQLGFYYLGPADGHDCDTLERLLRYARDLNRPVLIHIKTTKGMGYKFAIEAPERFHGVSSFDVNTGCSRDNSDTSFSNEFGKIMCRYAEENSKICAVTAAMQDGTGLSEFAHKFPERFFDTGITEEHAVTMCAAMAKQGMKPVFAVYSTFLQRCADQLINDTSLLNLPIVLAVDRAGIVGRDGETHNGIFDMGILKIVPHMEVFCPSNYAELNSMFEYAFKTFQNPIAIRYPRGSEGCFTDNTANQSSAVIREGNDITIVGFGIMINECIKLADMLKSEGYSADIIKINRIVPLDISEIEKSAEKTSRVVVLEDVSEGCCIGNDISAGLAMHRISLKTINLFNISGGFLPAGSLSEIYKLSGIDAESVFVRVLEILKDAKDTANV